MGVSIHALLAECDLSPQGRVGRHGGFNPRTPCGVRLSPQGRAGRHGVFQSTHSLRSATVTAVWAIHPTGVSIHALLAECDVFRPPLLSNTRSFNPRTPCGVRPMRIRASFSVMPVSIHALLAECDLMLTFTDSVCKRFLPRSPCRVPPNEGAVLNDLHKFQSTHSLRSATEQ